MNRLWFFSVSLLPLLGATRSLLQAAAICGCAVLLMVSHQALLTPLRRQLSGYLYLLASVLLIAALTSCLHMSLHAWALPLALALGHNPLLLSVQCLAADHLLPQQARWRSLALHLGGFVTAGLLLGALRQWLTSSTDLYLANLAPGALILLGLLLALYNRLRPGPAPSRRQGIR